VIQAITIVLGLSVIVIYLVVDVTIALLNPKVRVS
jgi:ABC-type dipeptide/oligopeptide/nickel transport system permease component